MADKVESTLAVAAQATAEVEVPANLFQVARRQLLVNEPLRARAGDMNSPMNALTEGESLALESVGVSTQRWVGEREHDPLVQSIADYMALLDTSLRTAAAAKYLKVDTSRIRQRLRERTLYGIEYDGERRLPKFQFERKRVIPGLGEVLAALPTDLNPLDVAEWFLSPNPDLEIKEQEGTLSPRDWLLSGRPVETVVAIARGFE